MRTSDVGVLGVKPFIAVSLRGAPTRCQGQRHSGITMDNTICDTCFSLVGLKTDSDYKGLINWGIVIHGFINGYSRLIVGTEASTNNEAATVLGVFLRVALANTYGVPSRVRGTETYG